MSVTDMPGAVAPTAPGRRSGLLVVGVVVAIVTTLVGVVGVVRVTHARAVRRHAAGGSALYLDWPARGSLRDDAALVARAVKVWNGEEFAPEIPRTEHTDVRVLYAEQFEIGKVVVMQGKDPFGVPTLGAVFVPPRTGYGGAPFGRWTGPLPDPVTTRHIALPVLTTMEGDGARLIVIGEPGTTTVAWSDVAHPDDLQPVYVQDGIGVAKIANRGVARVLVANARGTTYSGPLVKDFWVDALPPQEAT